jgi:thiosulfate/3-mercaptopyruvate sulfurtransferase
VTIPADPSPELADYAHPERLVTTSWLQEHSGTEGLVLLESNEDVLLYDTGHIPGAIKIDWHTELNDPVVRDYLQGEAFAELMSQKGISRDDTVVIYGDKSNWWAAYTLWVFTLFGHQDVRLVNGGRDAWVSLGLPLTRDVPTPSPSTYPVVERNDDEIRAFKEDVMAHLGRPLIDVRSPEEYSGERTHMPAYPEEGALRGGHIPTAKSIPWATAAKEDGRFKAHSDLVDIYVKKQGFQAGDDIITYCRIGERSSHTWFVMKYLLGFDSVKNYDGSWTEWGSAVRVPIAAGDHPGEAP